ncbi:hypothetical protein [Kitasatospora sp. NPDC093558]|uniref:hypothetical protein n=1 Tax=Kitasatospora sp. NPDC093558 TaxID=3155201 RepID=UPI0034489439
MLSKRIALTAATCVLLAAGATACGDDKAGGTGGGTGGDAAKGGAAATTTVPKLDTDKLSAKEIFKQAKDALAAASSVHIVGKVSSAKGEMAIDLALDNKGQCSGSMSLPGKGKVELVGTGKQMYMKPDKTFWLAVGGSNGAQVYELVKGRYVTGVEDDPKMKDLMEFCHLSKAAATMLKEDSGNPVKGEAGTVNGVKTFSLKEKDDDGEALIHIATEGKFYPVRVENAAGQTTGKIDFTDYDKPLTVQAPPDDQTIDLSVFKNQLKSA